MTKNASATQAFSQTASNENPAWLDTELQGSQFIDLRPGKQLWQFMGALVVGRWHEYSICMKSINPTRMPIEEKESYWWIENLHMATQRLGNPVRCVHVGDRKNDIQVM